MSSSKYLGSLGAEARAELEQRLLTRQSGRCFICDEAIDLLLHKGQLDVDHIDPLAEDGLDAENNFALTHESCNRSKGAANLQVARRIREFERLQERAKQDGKRGANLGDVLERHGGAKSLLRLRMGNSHVEFSLPQARDNAIHTVPVHDDKLSGMRSFFGTFPLEYLHHDDRINPRSIGSNIRGLIEEFLQKRPQLHVALAWWAPETDGAGPLKVFDGQHKAAAQILLGTRELPVRIFLEPDTNVLLQANTNAGGKLRQVAFDAAVMRHLGSSLYVDRVRKYQSMRGMVEDDYGFSEQDLVRFFKGERREMERYVIDAQRDAMTHAPDNRLLEFVEWAGKSLEEATVVQHHRAECLPRVSIQEGARHAHRHGHRRRLQSEAPGAAAVDPAHELVCRGVFRRTLGSRTWRPTTREPTAERRQNSRTSPSRVANRT